MNKTNTNTLSNAADSTSAALTMSAMLDNINQQIMIMANDAFDGMLLKIDAPDADTLGSILELGKKSEREQALRSCICEEIVKAAKDDLCVEHYNQRQRAQQAAHVFNGKYWEMAEEQRIVDFLKNAAEKMQIPVVYRNDPGFMNDVREQTLFCISRYKHARNDKDCVLVNLQNGTLDVTSGCITFREHRREDFLKYVLPYDYLPDAECCPRWTHFLDEVLPEKEAQQLLHEYIGYCLTKNLRLETHLVMRGPGGNGKSVVMNVITALLGMRNCSFGSLSSITTDANARLQLRDKLVNISHETDSKKIDTSMLKNLASGDPVEVHQKYVDIYYMSDYAKLITSFNTLPQPEETNGYWRRIKLLPFDYTVPEEKKVTDLDRQITATELPAILNLALCALEGLMQRKQFTYSPMCDKALHEYQLQFNSVLAWLTDRGYEASDTSLVALNQLYAYYKEYCKIEDLKPVGKNRDFQSVLKSLCGEPVVRHNAYYYKIAFPNE